MRSIASSIVRSVRASCADLMSRRAAGSVAILLVGLGVSLPAASPPQEAHPRAAPSESRDQVAWGVVLRQISPRDAEELEEEVDGTPSPVGRFLQEGDDVRVPEDGRLLVLLRDGRTHEFTEDASPPDVESGEVDPLFRLLRALLREEGLAPDAGAEGVDPGVASETSEFAAPLRPIGGRMVRSLTPTLIWRGEEEASEYRIHLWPPDGSVVTLVTGADSIWTVPSERALSPGTRYEWAVEPIPGERVGVRSGFRVASRAVLDGVAAQLGQLRSRGLEPEEDGLLIAAALFRSMGLPYDALDALSDLEAQGDGWSKELHAFRERLVVELESPETARDFSPDPGRHP